MKTENYFPQAKSGSLIDQCNVMTMSALLCLLSFTYSNVGNNKLTFKGGNLTIW